MAKAKKKIPARKKIPVKKLLVKKLPVKKPAPKKPAAKKAAAKKAPPRNSKSRSNKVPRDAKGRFAKRKPERKRVATDKATASLKTKSTTHKRVVGGTVARTTTSRKDARHRKRATKKKSLTREQRRARVEERNTRITRRLQAKYRAQLATLSKTKNRDADLERAHLRGDWIPLYEHIHNVTEQIREIDDRAIVNFDESFFGPVSASLMYSVKTGMILPLQDMVSHTWNFLEMRNDYMQIYFIGRVSSNVREAVIYEIWSVGQSNMGAAGKDQGALNYGQIVPDLVEASGFDNVSKSRSGGSDRDKVYTVSANGRILKTPQRVIERREVAFILGYMPMTNPRSRVGTRRRWGGVR